MEGDIVVILREAAKAIEKERKVYQPMADLVNWIIERPEGPLSDAEFVRKAKAKANAILKKVT